MATSKTRVIIIGAGVIGTLLAVRLAEAGCSVTVVERNVVGGGSSSRSAAAFRAQFTSREAVLGGMYSSWFYEHFDDLLEIPASERGSDRVAVRNGYLFLHEDAATVPIWRRREHLDLQRSWERAQAAARMQQGLGLPVEILDPDEVAQRWPFINGEEAWRLCGATWCPEDGFLRPNLVYVNAAARARTLGVTILEHTMVTGAVQAHGKITGVHTSARMLKCDFVVNATNASARFVNILLGGMSLPISPVKRYLTFAQRTTAFTEAEWRKLPMIVYGMGEGRHAYSRPEGGEQLMIGRHHEAEPASADFAVEDQDAVEEGFPHTFRAAESYAEFMRRMIAEFAPLLVAGDLQHTSCGFYGDTPDSNPIMGWDVQVPNLLVIAGFCGRGLMMAPFATLVGKALMCGEVTNGQVQLAGRCAGHSVSVSPFSASRDFTNGRAELHIL